MLIKNVFDKLDDAIAYMKACGAAAERVYTSTAEDGYHVDIIVNDLKFWEMAEEERKKLIACGAKKSEY